jgi:pyridoxamine 5'-phosphate oxidase
MCGDSMEQFHELRKEYSRQGLTEDMLNEDPYAQFKVWLDEAIA